jgi:hypothetical protein
VLYNNYTEIAESDFVKKRVWMKGIIMKFLFMDEKGPQNSFKVSNPFNMTNKISYADDNMHSYVANVIQINESDYMQIEQEYKKIVERYLSNRPQLKKSLMAKGKELKGLDLLKTNFEYGIASMKKNEVTFYRDLLELLLKYNVENLLFLISKMSVITSSRLINFFYFLDSNTKFSPYIAKYVVTKYAEVEASEAVVSALLDKSLPTKYILQLIQNDMFAISKKNLNNIRMSSQVDIYMQFINAINNVLNCGIELTEPDLPLSFDWGKVKWAFDLWLTEQRSKGTANQWWLFLDEGIPQDIFACLNLYKIDGNCNSRDYIGLQITDMIVALIGKMVSQLDSAIRYDFEKPNLRVLVSEGYFNLSEDQFDFIKKLQQFTLARQGKYHFINDAYFDDSVLLQTYIEYIALYENFEDYNKTGGKKHSELHMKYFINISQMKFEEGMQNEVLAKSIYGTIKAAVEDEMLRPL